MAHFYAAIYGNRGVVTRCGTESSGMYGNRGVVTRCGTESSGMYGHIHGWKVGCEVIIKAEDPDAGGDTVTIYLTAGSSHNKESKLIGTFTAEDLNATNIRKDSNIRKRRVSE